MEHLIVTGTRKNGGVGHTLFAALLCGFLALLTSCGDKEAEKAAEEAREDAEPPPSSAFPITPAPLEEDVVEYKLPDNVEDLVVGGSGRFLILHLKKTRKLAIFDVNEARITKYLPLASDDITFTAGAEKLFVGLRDKKILIRFDLRTFERELTQTVPLTQPLSTIAIGSSAVGPLLLLGGSDRESEILFVDPMTFKRAGIKLADADRTRSDLGRRAGDLAASSDGTVFGYTRHGVSPSGIYSLVIKGAKAHLYYEHDSAAVIVPSPDGRRLYTGGTVRTLEGKLIGEENGPPFLPAVHGNFTMTFTRSEEPKKRSVAIHLGTETRPLVILPHINVPISQELRLDKKIVYVPDANLIVTIPGPRDHLLLHRVDIDQALNASGVDYLYVRSRPPQSFAPGIPYAYQVEVKSKRSELKYTLDSGPEGMGISESGLLTWTVPKDITSSDQAVIVRISDASGQEVFHTFQIKPSTGATGTASPSVASSKPAPRSTPAPKPTPPAPPVAKRDPVPPPSATDNPTKKNTAPLFAAPELPEIKPPKMDGKTMEVSLPGPFDNLVLGGGGRFLILHHKAQRTLGIFDANEGRMVKFIPVADDNVLFAAGGDSLIILLKEKRIIQRWSLKTFERELTKTLGEPETPHWMVMGSASAGPLVIGGQNGRQELTTYFDPSTLEPITFNVETDDYARELPSENDERIRASADGSVITGWQVGSSPSGLYSTVIQGNNLTRHYEHSSVGYLVPSPDGNYIFTAAGTFTPELKAVGPSANRGASAYSIPAAHGSYYLRVPSTDNLRRGTKAPPISLHLIGESRPLISLPGIDVKAERDVQWSREKLNLDQRLIFIPDAKILVTYPEEQSKLILHRVDVDEELKKSEIDYLFVTSRPSTRAEPGKKWSYKPVVRSRAGDIKLILESAPDGMKSTGGELTWTVPDNSPSQVHGVILSIKDAAGQEIFHNFNLAVGDASSDQPPPIAPVKPVTPMKPSEPPVVTPPDFAGKDHLPYKLPGVLSDIAVGGGGRYLVMNFPSLRKLGIFDVNAAKIVEYIPAADDTLFAVGLTKLVMVQGDRQLLSRWDLTTFKRELIVPFASDAPLHFAVMGSASDGPLVIGSKSGSYDSKASFYDLASLRKLDLKVSGGRGEVRQNFRAGGNGHVFGSWATGTSPSGLYTVVKNGSAMAGHYEHSSVGHVLPSPDGRVIYTGRGMWSNEAKPIGPDALRKKALFPAATGDYYLSIDSLREWDKNTLNLGLYLRGHDRQLLPFKIKPIVSREYNRHEDTLPIDKRIHFIPAANMLVSVGITKDTLNLYNLNIAEALDKSGIDYLFVTSRPPAAIEAGQKLHYPIKVMSKQGGLKFKLESAPEGIAIDKDGNLKWDVPDDAVILSHVIIILISDKSGQEVFHTFDLRVNEAK